MPDRRPIRALLDRTGGGPTPGRPALVVADQGVGKTALLVHAALEGLAEDRRVLHVSLTDPVDRVRAWYDEISRGLRSVRPETAPNEVGVERRRMILSYAERPFDPAHLGAQLRMLKEVAQFDADLLILDGLDADRWLEHGEALSRLSGDLGMAAWFAVSSRDGVVRSVGASAFVVRLEAADGVMRLRLVVDDTDEELPWWLDPSTNLLGEGSAAGEPAEPPKASGCTLYTGGASGAEAAFGEAAERHGVKEVAFTFDGHRQARGVGSKLLTAWELEAGDVSLVYVSRRLHRSYNENGLIRKVLQTLWHMVSRSQQVFVVGAIQEDGTVVGGTGWSVELARMWEKDLWVYDQDRRGWYHWEEGQWRPGEARITSGELCGTGTRYLEESGRAAIDALFADAFGG